MEVVFRNRRFNVLGKQDHYVHLQATATGLQIWVHEEHLQGLVVSGSDSVNTEVFSATPTGDH